MGQKKENREEEIWKAKGMEKSKLALGFHLSDRIKHNKIKTEKMM